MSILTDTMGAMTLSGMRKKLGTWLERHPKLRNWLWFATLWLGGLFAAFSLAMVVKLMVRGLQQM